ncbi:hypothetical protein [Georgenia halophila]|uniref:hypothetical protein n=1 Tax=Georgenia halophila TaxID=620889 RepID=UPI0031ED0805
MSYDVLNAFAAQMLHRSLDDHLMHESRSARARPQRRARRGVDDDLERRNL